MSGLSRGDVKTWVRGIRYAKDRRNPLVKKCGSCRAHTFHCVCGRHGTPKMPGGTRVITDEDREDRRRRREARRHAPLPPVD